MSLKKLLLKGLFFYSLTLTPGADVSNAREFHSWVDIRDAGVVKQSLDYSCGVASMATLLSYYFQRPTDEEQLLQLLESREKLWQLPSDWRETGVSFAVLAQMAAYFKLEAMGVAVDPETLGSLSVPAIAYLEYRGFPHFTVIRGVDATGRVQLADSSWGNRVLSKQEFVSLWSSQPGGKGKLLLLRPAPGSIATPDSSYFAVSAAIPRIYAGDSHKQQWR